MNEAARIKLEASAMMLAKATEEVNEMLSQIPKNQSKQNNVNKGKKKYNPQKNQRGCQSLSNLNTSGDFTSTMANQHTAYTNRPPSYSESVNQHSQMGYNFPSSSPMYMNQQQMGQPCNYYPPNPINQFPQRPPLLFAPQQFIPPNRPQQQNIPRQYRPQQQNRPQQYRPQQQNRPQQYRPQQQHLSQQYRPQQQHQSQQHRPQLQQQKQQPTSDNKFPKPMPRKSLLQNKATSNVNHSASSQQDSSKSKQPPIDLSMLIRELSNFNGFFTSVDTLSKILDRDYNDVLNVLNNNSKIFGTIKDNSKNTDMVELCPKIKLCQDHIGAIGCNKQKCQALHLCANYINDKCEDKNCSFGHVWKTDHNNRILKDFHLAVLPNANLQDLMKKVFSGMVIPEICFDYHQDYCKLDDKCDKVHICYSYVSNLGNCSNGTNCCYNHNIRDPKCIMIFQNFGISTNESPRDLLKILKDRCLKGKEVTQGVDSNKSKNMPSDNQKTSISDQADKGTTSNVANPRVKKQEKDKPKFDANKTVCCWAFRGDVVKPLICIGNIKMKCNFISIGCKYLHCKHKSHWQFGSDDKWYNFHLHHSQILETKYNDAQCDDVTLPRLDYKRVKGQQTSLFSLIGKESCKIDFKSMTMDCKELKKVYYIRQLTTESSVICNDDESTVFKWYFLDDNGKWVLYGDSDSSCRIIETAYLQQPSGTYHFQSSKFTYLLDFSKMTQENLSSKKIRPIKRRPDITQDRSDSQEKFILPKLWEKMTDQEEYKMVLLSKTSEEYMDIRQIIKLSLPMNDIVSISRIQNSHLWKQFQNKKIELEKKYSDDLNIQKLLHGIDGKHLNDICRDNLEFRLHDDPSKAKPYGEGTYFYTSAGIAVSDCQVDFMGTKSLLVAEVIIGKVAAGNKGLTRPPLNPTLNYLYDTTTDKVENPTVFVKYNRQEYYPSYVVEFK